MPWLFLGALILVFWQIPLINVIYHQAGTLIFLQTAFQKGELPPHLPWLGQVEADPAPAISRLAQANDPFIPLQLSLNADRLLGVVALMTGDAVEAQQRLQSRLDQVPEDQIARFFSGEVYRRQGNFSEAIEQWALVGAQEPLMDMARDLIERQENAAALAALKAVMELDKTDTEPRWWAAGILSEQGDTEEALLLYQEIRKINPYSDAAHRRVAEVLLEQGELDQALAVYQEMIDLAPEEAAGYTLMARALFDAGRYEETLQAVEQALERQPEEPVLLLEMMGESYAALERWTEAIQVYKQAIDISPDRHRPYTLTAEAQCQAGTPDEARFYFEQAVVLGNQQEQVQQAIQYITDHGVCPP